MGPRCSSLVLATVVLGGCLGVRSSPRASPPPTWRVLSADEIATMPARTAYDAVRLLRPQFLRWTRGPQDSAHRLQVYVDGVRRGGVEELDGLPASLVLEIRFLSAPEATSFYGMGHPLGALAVRTGPPQR